jgi:hypothetical protein
MVHFGVQLDNREAVTVNTLDEFCRQRSIERIDFLKLDVEGSEYRVLMGARRLLESRAIKFIQFEFGGANIDARTYFRDFYNLLSPTYTIYLILKDGLRPVTRYLERSEVFLTTNYLAEFRT